MTVLIELLAVLLTSFGFNLIPFAGPSNLFIALDAAIVMGTVDPVTLIAIGFLVAIGASLAKSLHYLVTFFLGKRLKGKVRQRLDEDAAKIKRWAFCLLYLAAATPVPDEPIVIPLGLMKYSPTKFFTAYFLGKLTITIAGAFLGQWTKSALSGWLSPELTIGISIVLTIVVTVILLKVDFNKLTEELAKKLRRRKSVPVNEEKR